MHMHQHCIMYHYCDISLQCMQDLCKMQIKEHAACMIYKETEPLCKCMEVESSPIHRMC